MSAWNGIYELTGDVLRPCGQCGDEHPEGVLDGDLCPACVDEGDAWDLPLHPTPSPPDADTREE